MSGTVETLRITGMQVVHYGYLVRVEAANDNGVEVTWTCTPDNIPNMNKPVTVSIEWSSK